MAKIAEKEQQDIIAQQYRDEVNKLKQQETDERNKEKQRKEQYYQQLNSQLKEQNKKKTYSVLMSEYERSVNDNDIKAYQNMDTQNLYAMIPGYNANNPQEKYIDKAMNLYTPQKQVPKINDCICPPESLLANSEAKGRNSKLQNAALRSFENFGDGKGIDLKLHELNVSPNKLERVRQNMEKEDAIKYRANTNNRGYGVSCTYVISV